MRLEDRTFFGEGDGREERKGGGVAGVGDERSLGDESTMGKRSRNEVDRGAKGLGFRESLTRGGKVDASFEDSDVGFNEESRLSTKADQTEAGVSFFDSEGAAGSDAGCEEEEGEGRVAPGRGEGKLLDRDGEEGGGLEAPFRVFMRAAAFDGDNEGFGFEEEEEKRAGELDVEAFGLLQLDEAAQIIGTRKRMIDVSRCYRLSCGRSRGYR